MCIFLYWTLSSPLVITLDLQENFHMQNMHIVWSPDIWPLMVGSWDPVGEGAGGIWGSRRDCSESDFRWMSTFLLTQKPIQKASQRVPTAVLWKSPYEFTASFFCKCIRTSSKCICWFHWKYCKWDGQKKLLYCHFIVFIQVSTFAMWHLYFINKCGRYAWTCSFFAVDGANPSLKTPFCNIACISTSKQRGTGSVVGGGQAASLLRYYVTRILHFEENSA